MSKYRRRSIEGVSLVPMPGYEPDPSGNTRGNPGVPISDARTGAKLRRLHFPRAVKEGENITGFESQTVNGTGRAGNDPGHNQVRKYTTPKVEKVGPWKSGNRSAE